MFDEINPNVSLAKRQKQLLGHINTGQSNREIALDLGISEHTVKVHLWHLYKRLSVKNRTQALYQARASGLM